MQRNEQKSIIDYLAVDERIKKDVLDARVVRGMFDRSNHHVVVAKIRIRGRWEYGKMCKSKGRQVIAVKGWIGKRLERKRKYVRSSEKLESQLERKQV